jgi:FkbM family methyltransferase
MLPRTLRERLNEPRPSLLRSLAAAASTVFYSVRRGSLQRFAVDRDGYWVNRASHGTVVSPGVHTVDPREAERIVMDDWCHAYVPRVGDVVVDVGAGIGEETVVFARLVGSSGRVVAIEAHPRTAECLRRTVALNGFTNVTVLDCAVSDAEGTVKIQDSEAHLSNSIVASGGGVDVRARTIDEIAETLRLPRIDFLKMNIEGAERPALRGMTASFARIRHACISCHDFVADVSGDDSMRTRRDVLACLEKNGFDTRSHSETARPWVRDNVYATNARAWMQRDAGVR